MPNGWDVKFLNENVEAEYEGLPKESRAKISWIINIIKQEGIEELHEPYIKHLQDKLWEIRGKSGRAMYITITGKLVVILRCFTKKSNQTPQSEIELALRRLKEFDGDE